jgi:RsiW-degrading membrane proteinase PrsW (M82 family)
MQCPNCGRSTQGGEFCEHCGARLPADDRPLDPDRSHRYAANPNEHVLHLSVISTLFPHLDPHRTLVARWLLAVSAVVLFLLGLGKLVPLAIVLAALLVPALYLGYFYVAEAYADEPVRVLAGTFVAGMVLGAVASVAFYRVILSQRLLGFDVKPGYVLLTGVLLPVIAQALMLVGPLVLYFTLPRFREPLDGLVFGAASGLGFAAAQSVIYSWALIAGPFARSGSALSWALPVVRIALIAPLLDAATTALICTALWLSRNRQPDARRSTWLEYPIAAVLVALVGQILPSLGYDLVGSQILALIWYGAPVAIVLVLIRVQLHHGLIGRAQALGHGGTLVCPHCHHRVADVAFCPFCGLALGSISRRERREARPTGGEEAEGAHG